MPYCIGALYYDIRSKKKIDSFLCTYKHDCSGQCSCFVTHSLQLLHRTHQKHGAVQQVSSSHFEISLYIQNAQTSSYAVKHFLPVHVYNVNNILLLNVLNLFIVTIEVQFSHCSHLLGSAGSL